MPVGVPWSTTVLHPGHIVGRGWVPLNPGGHFDPGFYAALKAGRDVIIPDLGMNTVGRYHLGPPFATENLLQNTDGVLRPHQCSLGAAACYFLYMIASKNRARCFNRVLPFILHSTCHFDATAGFVGLPCGRDQLHPVDAVLHIHPQTHKNAVLTVLCCFDVTLMKVHHIHADDIASLILVAMAAPKKCNGQAFNIVSPQAVTLSTYARRLAAKAWPATVPSSNLKFMPSSSEGFLTAVGEAAAARAVEHIAHSPCCSIEKIKSVLGFTPAWSSLDAVADAVEWLDAHGLLE